MPNLNDSPMKRATTYRAVTSKPPGFMASFLWGASLLLQSARLIIKKPSLLALVAIPFALNIALYVFLILWAGSLVSPYILEIGTAITHALGTFAFSATLGIAASWILKIAFWLLMSLMAAFTFTFVGGLLMSPLNDYLSRQTTKIYFAETEQADQNQQEQTHFSLARTMLLEFKRMVIILGFGLLLFLIGSFPLMQLPAFFAGGYLLCFEYLGYPFSQYSSRLREISGFMLNHKAACLGFGSALLVLMTIPFASMFYLPLAVVGGTLLYHGCLQGAKTL